jgi:hypothetical protein
LDEFKDVRDNLVGRDSIAQVDEFLFGGLKNECGTDYPEKAQYDSVA